MTDDPAMTVFPPSARALQEARGSRRIYAKRDRPGGFPSEIDARLIEFIARIDTMFIATATADGAPYVQHRGGPAGFLRALDKNTLAFADYAGNQQYITLGRLAENDRVSLFLIDFAHQARIKIWGRAKAVECDAGLTAALADDQYPAKIERAILITVDAWDINCRQHITRKVNLAEVEPVVAELEQRVASLQAEIARLQSN